MNIYEENLHFTGSLPRKQEAKDAVAKCLKFMPRFIAVKLYQEGDNDDDDDEEEDEDPFFLTSDWPCVLYRPDDNDDDDQGGPGVVGVVGLAQQLIMVH